MNTHNLVEKSEWSNGFISGLVCGEGNFTIAIVKSKTTRLGYHVRPLFQLEMNISDRELVCQLVDFFGYGSISYPKPRVRFKSESATCKYSVSSLKDCLSMVDFFTVNPLVGAKQESFSVWSQCLEIINSGSHQSSDGFMRIVELRSKINGMRRPSTFRKFKDLPSEMLDVNPARNVSSWTSDELEMIASYIDGLMSRNELNKKLGRSIPSISNKISRESKNRMESEQQKDV